MKKNFYFLMFTFILVSLFSCKKQKEQEVVEEPQTSIVQEEVPPQPLEPEPAKPRHVSFDAAYNFVDQELSLTAFHTDAHSEFLDDPMVFMEIPNQGIEEGKTAVVASYVCMLYPDEAFTFKGGGEALINPNIDSLGVPVPFGTIVQIEKKLDNYEEINAYAQRMFNFQDNWNWFYYVKYGDTQGWVYGADLYGINDTIENNRVSAMLYQTKGKFEEFYPVTGYIALEENVMTSLENNKLAIQQVTPESYVSIDDMVDLYRNLQRKKNLPVFITTDFAAHCQHLIFDRMLQYTEEEYFLPAMSELTDAFITALEKRIDAPADVREKAIQYFQVPQLIMKTAPSVEGDGSYYSPIVYVDQSTDAINEILSQYPAAVQTDYKSIMSAAPGTEEIFQEDEDFSQYKPRGHYTKNGLLETYFRAQMWYGHLHFSIAKPKSGQTLPQAILDKEAAMMLIVDTVQKDDTLYYMWSELFEPITALIGMSDDLSFYDICPLWKDQNVTDFSQWASDQNNLHSFMSLCAATLRPPAISGQSVFNMYSEQDEETGMPSVPMGWRLFGQRFTYDSFVHEKVSPPRLLSRDFVRGLDIMKAFGSKTAEALLAKTDYQTMPGLKEVLDSFETEIAAYDSSFWNQSYYNQVLYQVKTQATFEQGAGFYFTETPAWNIKSQLAAHGTWAELRHDTILYVKQTAAERAGDGDFDPTFRTEPLPKPVHYVEPNVPFWEGSVNSVANLIKIYNFYGLLDSDSERTLNSLMEMYQRLLAISKQEAQNLPISQSDNDWLPTVASSFGNLVMVHNRNGYISDNDLLKMACIADVFTNNDYGACLEVGVAVPFRLYIPLNDSQGGKRIAIGYGFSYVEFLQSAEDRMTDEQWKTIVYKTHKDNLDEYMPFWEKECILDATKF
ncbi:MAG: DUF3160 domain-containing protein [Treponema sp.]|nr:DUF3160 domain-containing protein [Treponema sp.]